MTTNIKISVVDPVNKAIETVRQTLFRPFDLAKWFVLGFTAWLAMLSGGGGFPGLNFNFPSSCDVGAGGDCASVVPWLRENFLLVLAVGVPLVLLAVAIGLAVSWVSCRGKFMFLDNVMANRAEVRDVWRRMRASGNSLFWFMIVFGLVSLALLAALVVTFLLVAAPDLARRALGGYAIAGMVGGMLSMLVYVLALGCVLVFLDDFVVPLMRLRDCRVMTGWGLFWALFKQHPGVFVLYLLFRMVLMLAVGIAGVMLCCVTCCLALLPYLGAVVLLPLHVFMRAYSLHFLEQFGDTYRFFERMEQCQ